MDGTVTDGYLALTEKEKATLRLLLAGHDAKSMARHFGLSVHTINERLRDARRKLSVSSSREAARLLREREGGTPENVGDGPFGDAAAVMAAHPAATPGDALPAPRRRGRVIGGLAMLTILAATLALLAPVAAPPADTPPAAAGETDAGAAARAFLALGDAGRWDDGYAATGGSFHALNTAEAWRAASEKARVPLGRMLSRTLVDERDVPAPPNGYRTVRFRTDFANRRGAIETVSLDREDGTWKVVGVYIE